MSPRQLDDFPRGLGSLSSRLVRAIACGAVLASCAMRPEPAARGENCYRTADCAEALLCIESRCSRNLASIVPDGMEAPEPPAGSRDGAADGAAPDGAGVAADSSAGGMGAAAGATGAGGEGGAATGGFGGSGGSPTAGAGGLPSGGDAAP